MIETKGMVTVAEAARRLNRSIEQVRRYLREGKLKGQRIGNQWFVDEKCLGRTEVETGRLIPAETIAAIRQLRAEINEFNRRRGGPPFDAVEMVRQHRDED